MKTKILALAVIGLVAVQAGAQVTVSTAATGFSEPYNVIEDAGGNIYISDSAADCIVKIDAASQAITTLTGVSGIAGSNDGPAAGFSPAHFFDPQGLILTSLNGVNGLLVADSGNNLIRFINLTDGDVTTLAGQINAGPATDAAGANATFNNPIGMTQDGNGNVYIADSGNNVIRVMNLNDPAFGVTNLVISGTMLSHPSAVAFMGANQLWVADSGNNTIKLITLATPTTGSLTSYMGSDDSRTSGTTDSPFGPSALFNNPSGLLWVDGAGLFISDTGNNLIRQATNNPAYGAMNYAVTTFAGTVQSGVGQAGLVNGDALSSEFNSPIGLCQDLFGSAFLVADLKNNVIRRIQNGPPPSPPSTPIIGTVSFPSPNNLSVLTPITSSVFNNDVIIAIQGTDGSQTFYTSGPTPVTGSIPDPNSGNGTTPPAYEDGLPGVADLGATRYPDMTIKAVSVNANNQNSSIVSARFQFDTANPTIIGNNAAQFTVTDLTTNAQMYYTYTIDGSEPLDPTNGPPAIGPISSGTTLSLNAGDTNLIFKICAFRDSYKASAIVKDVFSPSAFVPNTISFGAASGEASSDFVASPGQTFYAPVTLSALPDTVIYSLQFEMTVTNNGSSPAVVPGAYGFQSMLMKPIPDTTPPLYTNIPPWMFTGAGFTNLEFTNFSSNLLGVGWLERAGETNLYDTTKQDLIQYSLAHDDLFPNSQSPGFVIIGGYSFLVPSNAAPGDTYQIQIGRPSATSDGIGAPGSSIFIFTPTNGSLAGGTINSIKNVAIGQRKYIAGDCYPFRWFNAGDFGNTNLENADVEQVFQSAAYSLNFPPPGSDFFDSMDSCGEIGAPSYTYTDGTGSHTVYTNTSNAANENLLFNGDDTTINQIAFGDGRLDVCDVYVTFRRSLDSSLTWFQRYWTTNGNRVAETVGNSFNPQVVSQFSRMAAGKSQLLLFASITNEPQVNFYAGDFQGSAGQTVQIPVTAQIFGNYPLRVLMLNLTVVPLDGSPALTTSVSFSQNPALGTPTLTDSTGANNYAAAWLDSSISGLTGSNTIGTLTVTIPANATSSSAYAVHFDHASASPNGLASFPKQTLTGLITLSSRTNSSYGDGIPDSWRLRYFGTVNNMLSASNADADGDGMDNWREYVAGTDPTDPQSFFKNISTDQAAAQQPSDAVISWPSVSGKQYVIECSSTLFPPAWTSIATNNGTGTEMEFHDASSGSIRFYRVSVH